MKERVFRRIWSLVCSPRMIQNGKRSLKESWMNMKWLEMMARLLRLKIILSGKIKFKKCWKLNQRKHELQMISLHSIYTIHSFKIKIFILNCVISYFLIILFHIFPSISCSSSLSRNHKNQPKMAYSRDVTRMSKCGYC